MRIGHVIRKSVLVCAAVMVAASTSGLLPMLTGRAAAVSFGLDKRVSAHASSGTSVTSPTFSTTQTNELLVAFLSADGPDAPNSQSYTSVTGGGLTWRLRQRTNAQAGTAEIWTAAAASTLTNVTVKGTHGGSNAASITVATFMGADTGATAGAAAGNSAASGASTLTLITTRAGSWVWAAGTDWDRRQARTVGSNQVEVDEYQPSVGDTYWVQRQNNPTPNANTAVTMNDTSPVNDRWDLAALEIIPAVVDTTPPSAPGSLAAAAPAANQVVLNWAASTDDVGVAGYKVFRDGSQVGTASVATYNDSTVTPSTTYTYTVRAYDSAGNTSADSNAAIVTTPTPDTIAPAVQLTAPSDGATITGTTTISATASDDVGVAGVQFLLDGVNLGPEITTAGPSYGYAWDSTAAVNGSHTIAARAHDAAGNATASAFVTVTTSNVSHPAPSIDPSTPSATAVASGATSATSPSFSPPAGTVVYAAFSIETSPNHPTSVASVSNTGTPLAWHLLGREEHINADVGGFLEVWWAYNPTAQSSVTATATFSQAVKTIQGPTGDLQILVMNNAAADQSAAAWNPNWLITDKSNTASVTVNTTAANSKVFAVFDNWDNDSTPVPAAGQTIQSIVLNTIDRDGYWVQAKTDPVATPGSVQMSATYPGTADSWHALAWEVLAAN